MIAHTVDAHLGEIRLNRFKLVYALSWEQRETARVCACVCVWLRVYVRTKVCVFIRAKLCLFIYKAVARGDCVLYGLLYAVARVHCEEAVCVGTASLW